MPRPKKTYRTIKDSYRTGRFTREQIRAAVLKVKAQMDAEEAAARAALREQDESAEAAEARSWR